MGNYLMLSIEKIDPDLYREIEHLLYASWDSTKSSLGNGKLNLDMQERYSAQTDEKYVVAILRDVDDVPVGVCSFWINYNKLQSKPFAQNDLIYVKPEYRVNGNAKKLWGICITELLNRKVFDIRMNVPLSSPQSFFKALGMTPRSITYGKVYDEESNNTG